LRFNWYHSMTAIFLGTKEYWGNEFPFTVLRNFNYPAPCISLSIVYCKLRLPIYSFLCCSSYYIYRDKKRFQHEMSKWRQNTLKRKGSFPLIAKTNSQARCEAFIQSQGVSQCSKVYFKLSSQHRMMILHIASLLKCDLFILISVLIH
jgi:hypothetical protein